MDMTDLQNGTMAMYNNFSANSFLKEKLTGGVVDVLFLKKDGSQRRMKCTLRQDLLPAQVDLEEAVQKKTPNPDLAAVWDIDKQAWRSFRYDSIIGFSEVE